jgi:pilus assembly protein FimV
MSKPLNAILLILAAVLLVPIASYAAGLGTLTVRSALGQPLDAELEVLSLRPGEETFQVRLASQDVYRNAGMEVSPALNGVRFSVENRGGKTFIRIRTAQPVNDPFLNLFVELHFTAGRLARQYTVLVDPVEYKVATAPAAAVASPVPVVTPAEPVAAAPVAAPTPVAPAPIAAAPVAPAPVASAPVQAEPVAASPAPQPTVAATAPQPTAAAPAASAAPASAPSPVSSRAAAAETPPTTQAASADGYVIKRGDTLGAIARKWKHEGVTIQQMMIGLYQLNPGAFIRENINLIRAGSTLVIPGREEVLAIRDEEAVRQFRAQMAEFSKIRRIAAAGAGGSAPSLQAQRDMASRRIAVKKTTRSM